MSERKQKEKEKEKKCKNNSNNNNNCCNNIINSKRGKCDKIIPTVSILRKSIVFVS